MRQTARSLFALLSFTALTWGASALPDLIKARNRQDRAALDGIVARLKSAVQSQATAENQYQLASAYSYAAEVAIQQKDKRKAQEYAEAGVDAAQKAVQSDGAKADYHRVLGELCGQVIPASPLLGAMKYGQCARDEIERAIQLDGSSAMAYLNRGVGNFYLPEQMGGGVELALKDMDKAISLNPKLSDAYLWKGIALRKANRNKEARQNLQKAVELTPDWTWAQEQLQKTPAQ